MAVIIKDSEIEGKGIFADRDFKKGEVILKWDTSNELTKGQVDELTDDEKARVSYLEGRCILMQEPERYMNHSCDANTYIKDFCDIAKRDIKKGEELTEDYTEEEDVGTAMKCNCGSKNCVGIVK